MRQFALLISVLTLLSSCSNDSGDFQTFKNAVQPDSVPADPRIQPLLDAGVPRLQVAFLESGLAGLMLQEADRDGVKTWLSTDGATLQTREGLIVGTRGFGGGMMASDVSQSLNAVYSGRSGDVTRFHSFLTGEDETATRSYKCVVEDRGDKTITIQGKRVATRLMRETCHSMDQEFLNLYWISDATGRIVQSRQWLGDFLGVVTMREIAG
jgi:group 4 capsule polysaccharide lipoprotein GfcB/YjbF